MLQEVPSPNLHQGTSDLGKSMEYSLVPGYEDLGVFFAGTQSKQEVWNTDFANLK